MEVIREQEINDLFPKEHLYSVQDLGELEPPWFADFANYLARRVLLKGLSYQQKKFLFDLKDYLWENSYWFHVCADPVVHLCISTLEGWRILEHCHVGPTG